MQSRHEDKSTASLCVGKGQLANLHWQGLCPVQIQIRAEAMTRWWGQLRTLSFFFHVTPLCQLSPGPQKAAGSVKASSLLSGLPCSLSSARAVHAAHWSTSGSSCSTGFQLLFLRQYSSSSWLTMPTACSLSFVPSLLPPPQDNVSHSQGWPSTPYVAEVDSPLTLILLPRSPKCWGFRCGPRHLRLTLCAYCVLVSYRCCNTIPRPMAYKTQLTYPQFRSLET